MSKILIVVSSMSENAAGNVFRNYILKLREQYELDIISNDSYEGLESNLVVLDKQKKIFKRLSLACIGYDIQDFRIAEQVYNRMKNNNYKIVISMFSANQFFPLYLAYFFKINNSRIKWLNYCVDALPAPLEWGEPNYYRFGIKKLVNKFILKSDFIYFSNEKMAEYQKNVFRHKDSKVVDALYAYPKLNFKTFDNEDNFFNFVYTGTVYKARKVERFLQAFEKLSYIYPNIQCTFVGTKPKSINLSCLKKETLEKIKFLPYTNKLENIYSSANVLVDIDADIKDDVFMSSKFFNYISTNKPILSITNINSPTYSFINDLSLEGVYMSQNNIDEIFTTLKSMVEAKMKIDYRSRYKKIINFLDKNFNEKLCFIINNFIKETNV